MTNDEKKAWLSQYRRLDARIERLLAEERAWRDKAARVSAPAGGMPRGPGTSDPVGNLAVKLADLQADINRDIDRLVDLRRDIEKAVTALPDAVLADLLRRRYIDGQSLEDIADAMHYAPRHVVRLHAKALGALVVAGGA